MKKITILSVLVSLAYTVIAQNVDDIKKYALLGQTKSAKEAVDKYLAVEKNAKKADGWFWKGFIYNALSKDSSNSVTESSNLKSVAFDALKKYRETDSKAPLLEEENNSTLFELYVGFSSDLGVNAYRKKNVEGAFDNFKKCLVVHDYIYANNLKGAGGFAFSALDTTLTFYTAIAAGELKKDDDAAMFYKKLTDANVAEEQYLQAYEFLADYYKTKKDKVSFAAIIDKGKKVFPKNEYWVEAEILEATEGLSKPDLIKKYKELMGKYPDNFVIAFNTAFEIYTYVNDSKNAAATDLNGLKAEFPDVLKKAIAIKSTIDGNYMMTSFFYNNSIDLAEEARKLIKPADAKRKNELNAQSALQLNQAIPYAETVVSLYEGIQKPKGSEKINYRQALNILKNIYELKKDTAKAAIYAQKVKATE